MKVSVLMITYNHERFIAQALDSVLMQQVDFGYEIVIGEDCSTDATRAILLDYKKKYPDIIRVLLPEKNLGMLGNFAATLDECRGDYIALLDGDDYWTSPDKLQRQVDYLDHHPECSACFHNALVVHDDAPERDHLFHEPPLQKPFYDLQDIVSSHFIPVCSTVFRARLFSSFPEWYAGMPMQDWPLHILNAEHGTYGYIDDVMAAYRVHGGSAWSVRSRLAVLDKTIYACHTVKGYLGGRYARNIGRLIREFEIEAAEILREQADFSGAFRRLLCAFRASPRSCSRIASRTWHLLSAWIRQ
jgi:glycosyltransferase involved in cell wall biosynthesis